MTAGTQSRQALPPQPGAAMAYEYERNGVSNLFMLFAPLEGWRRVEVTDRRIPVKGGETPGGFPARPEGLRGGVVRARIFVSGPVQEKCEEVSSYGLWGWRARTCARMLLLERMLHFARFADTTQIGRVCKKSVRPSGRGVQGGSLSKKLRLN